MPCFPVNNTHFAAQHQHSKTSIGKRNHGLMNTNQYATDQVASAQTNRCIGFAMKNRFGKNIQIKDYELCNWYNGNANTNSKYNIQNGKKKFGKREPTLSSKEITRLKTAATTQSIELRLEELSKQEAESKHLDRETEKTRQNFRKIDDQRKRLKEKKNQHADSTEVDESQQVLERAFYSKHDQEEEVKRVNRIILNAKCHAVRDAQIQEKIEIEKAQKKNDMLLEQIVLESAKKSLVEEDEQHERNKVGKLKYASEIKQQLNERERLRFLEAEYIEEEAKKIRKANEAIKREEEQQLQLAKERRHKLREELDQIAEMSNLFKRMLCEQECEAEMRVAAYQREQAERERQLKMEKKIAKEAFERKQQRIYTLAQKILESKSQREEQRYLREQEQIDREYRQKEMEAVIRKRRIEKELRESREMQLQETKNRQAAQIARAEKDFNNLVELLKAEEIKQNQLDSVRKRERDCYRKEIIKQINSKDMERRHLEELENQRISAWRESERQRESNIRTVINAKIQAMRDACLPEKYIKEVEMQLQKMSTKRNE